MNQLITQHANFKQNFKIRFVIIPSVLILLILFLPAFVNFAPNYVPSASFENTGDYGYSQVFSRVQIPTMSYRDYFENFNTYAFSQSPNTLLVIASPYYGFSQQELDILKNRLEAGLPTMLIGTTLFSHDIAQAILTDGWWYTLPIYDFDDNVGSPSVIHVYNPTTHAQYVSIKPHSLDIGGDSLLVTANSSMTEKNYLYDIPCGETINGTYVIDGTVACHKSYPVAQMKGSLIVVTDPWMMKNTVVSTYSQNINVLADVLNQANLNIDQIVFDESHYRWMDVNPTGFKFTIRRLTENGFFVFFLALIAFFIPLVTAIRYELIDVLGKKSRTNKFAKKLAQRLDNIHTQQLLVVPLTAEEQILTTTKLESRLQPPRLFSHAASEYLKYFNSIATQQQYGTVVPNYVLAELQHLATNPVSTEVAWQILENAHFIALKLQEFVAKSSELDTPYGDIL